MCESEKFDTMVPHIAPVCGDARTLLFAIRRLTIHGLRDAHAANAMLARYGMQYREPLFLLRKALVEVARNARGNIVVAPCCSPCMTNHEHALLTAINDPDTARATLAPLVDVTGIDAVSSIVTDLAARLRG